MDQIAQIHGSSVTTQTSSKQASTSEAQNSNKQPSIYGKIPPVPLFEAVDGIKYDFNDGIRVLIPAEATKTYHVTFTDLDAGVILYSNDAPPGSYITSVKKFYVRFGLIIHDKETNKELFRHDYDCTGKDVMIQLPVNTLGDSIGWFSYV